MPTKIYQVIGKFQAQKMVFTFSVDCPCKGKCGEVFPQNFEVTNDSGNVWELKSLDDSVHECKKTGIKFFFTTAFMKGKDVDNNYINCQIVGEKSL